MDSASRRCDITLGWMMSKGEAQGLAFASGFQDIIALLPQLDAPDAMHETLRPAIRSICEASPTTLHWRRVLRSESLHTQSIGRETLNLTGTRSLTLIQSFQS
jgi:hypothetical protein